MAATYHHLAGLQRAIGVTRVAQLTGLDRCGVEVASAVRPEGHVLQVSNGKGDDFAQAERGALHEAAELWAAEQVPTNALLGTSESVPLAWQAVNGVTAWLPAQTFAGKQVWIPAHAACCLPAGSQLPGAVTSTWVSNGLAAHPSLDAALLHGLLEAWEREALVRVLPNGFYAPHLKGRRLTQTPRATELERRGFSVGLFDLTPRGCTVPVAGALLLDLEDGPVPVTAGYAARAGLSDAVDAALLEAAQSRLTEIHAAREDVSVRRESRVAEAKALLEQLPMQRWKQTKPPALSPGALARRLDTEVAWLELAPGLLPLHVIKAFPRGYRVSELLT